MQVSSDDAIIEAVWRLLAQDAELGTIMGGVRQYHEWAEPDAEFPYLVHLFRSVPTATSAVRLGTYVLDIWDYAPTAAHVAEIQRRVTELLERAYLKVPDLGLVRLWNQRWEPVPTGEKDIWRRSSFWDVRYAITRELGAIVTRS